MASPPAELAHWPSCDSKSRIAPMNRLRRLFLAIRCQLLAVSCQLSSPTREPDFAAINRRSHWPTNTTRSRWVAGL